MVTTDGIVAVGNANGGPAAWYSGDGMTWKRAYVEDVVVDSEFYGEMTASRLAQVFESDGQLLAIGLPSLGTPIGFISADGGRTWLQDDRFVWHEDPERWSGGSAFVTDVVSTPAGWAATGHRASPGWAIYLPWHVGWSSPDGREWSVMDADASLLGRELDQGAEVGALAVDDGTIYAVGSSIWTSEDGGRWKEEEPPIPRHRGGLDGVADDDGMLIVSENYGDEEQESLGGRIWARVGGAWRKELSMEPPSSIDALAEYSFGVIAAGTRDGLPVGWQRDQSGKWLELPTFETEPGWVGAAVEFQGRLLISGSLTEPDGENIDASRQAVVWIGNPPSPSTATPAPQGEMVPVPTSPPNTSGVCHQALLEGVLVRDPDSGLAVEHDESRTAIRWPNGFVAREGPEGLELLDADGRVVAREGDGVRLGGGGNGDIFWTCSTPEVVPSALTGILMGDPNYEGGCVWVSERDGLRWAVAWPEPYRLELSGEEAILYRGDAVVGREGDQVMLRGTLGDDSSYCGASYDAIEVTEVRATP